MTAIEDTDSSALYGGGREGIAELVANFWGRFFRRTVKLFNEEKFSIIAAVFILELQENSYHSVLQTT